MKFLKRRLRSFLIQRLGLQDARMKDPPFLSFDNFLGMYFAVVPREPFFFMQIGANDGVSGDPLNPFIRKYKLPGLLVEPQAQVFESLKANYAAHDNLLFENSAIAENAEQKTLYQIAGHVHEAYNNRAKRPATEVASFNKDHVVKLLRKNVPDILEKDGVDALVKEDVFQTKTISQLVQAHNIERINFLQIDTEGYDYRILKSFFEECDFRPQIINFEILHVPDDDKKACLELLRSHGYHMFHYNKHDVCAYRVQ